jgi:hypothetical protein
MQVLGILCHPVFVFWYGYAIFCWSIAFVGISISIQFGVATESGPDIRRLSPRLASRCRQATDRTKLPLLLLKRPLSTLRPMDAGSVAQTTGILQRMKKTKKTLMQRRRRLPVG